MRFTTVFAATIITLVSSAMAEPQGTPFLPAYCNAASALMVGAAVALLLFTGDTVASAADPTAYFAHTSILVAAIVTFASAVIALPQGTPLLPDHCNAEQVSDTCTDVMELEADLTISNLVISLPLSFALRNTRAVVPLQLRVDSAANVPGEIDKSPLTIFLVLCHLLSPDE
ncbi:hypothetical protein NP233_g8109 [Leucocoprinus birnbaumii]|uniref:Uncharacterized protein n=1 Tax=Leucocoprinus birnbaumii TaxID=56174 RepID=A0AAD5VMZ1_9AGAR|nr:hypothetical protein NP233_g8109 [Leucocoprinus birnbaumii]